MQFIKLDKKILENNELTVTDKLIYSILCDRMDSSRKRNSFYDKKHGNFFVIYTIDEMKDLLGLSKTPVVNSYKRLENLGLIKKLKSFNSATHIFLPNYVSPENGTSEVHNVESNHTDTKHTDITKDTKDTVDDDRFNNLKQSLKEVGGFDDKTIGILSTYSFGSYDKLYELVGTIYKAKYAVLTKNKGVSGIKLALALDYSDYFKDMHKTAKYVILHAKSAKNYHGYIFAAFKQYFENAVNYYIAQNTENRVNIPLLKLC